jgi:predicted nucleic acid-binding protein
VLPSSVLLDTSFWLAVLDPERPHHAHATGYLRYLLEQQVPLYLSTISAAELAELLPLVELPAFGYCRLLAFNLRDAEQAAELATQLRERATTTGARTLSDDCKVLAQVMTQGIGALAADDAELAALVRGMRPTGGFRYLDVAVPHEAAFALTGSLF